MRRKIASLHILIDISVAPKNPKKMGKQYIYRGGSAGN